MSVTTFDDPSEIPFNPFDMETALEQGNLRLLIDRKTGVAVVITPWHTDPAETHRFFDLAQAQGYTQILGMGSVSNYKIKDTSDCDYWVISA